MPAEEPPGQAWPPAPACEPLARPSRYRWMLGWIGPLLCGIVGAVAGGILLPVVLLVMIYITNDAGGPLGFLVAMILAVVFGAGAGFICGLAAWFIGKGVTAWWNRRRSHRRQGEA